VFEVTVTSGDIVAIDILTSRLTVEVSETVIGIEVIESATPVILENVIDINIETIEIKTVEVFTDIVKIVEVGSLPFASKTFSYIQVCFGAPTDTPPELDNFVNVRMDVTNGLLYYFWDGAWQSSGGWNQTITDPETGTDYKIAVTVDIDTQQPVFTFTELA
jgi:hypothetical protein